jgi:two-component system, OmpR family, response regulator
VTKLVPPERKPGASAQAASIEDAFEVELDIDVDKDQPQEAMELTGKIRVSGGGNVTAELRGEKLTATVMPKGQATGMRPPPPGRVVAVAAPVKVDGKSRRGNLTDNLPSLITAFYLSKETGELGVQRGKVKKVVYFEKGTPVFALSNLAADRFGQFLVRVGKVKPEQMAEAAAIANAHKRRTGDVLVERGLLKDTERLYYVGQQVKAIIYSLFAWEDGTYVMSFKERAATETIKLDVHPANLIIRGVKKLYKPERLKRVLHPDERLIPSLQPAYSLNDVELEKWEAEFLPKVNGTKSVTELIAMTNRPPHVVYGFLYGLLALTILERRTG